MIPTYIQQELSKLSNEQKSKFQQLLMWSSASGLPGIILSHNEYVNILNMVKQMGENPINPVMPDIILNPDWESIPRKF